MSDCMIFPETFSEFVGKYHIIDTKQIYTNGAELIPVFRVKQWLEHIEAKQLPRGHWIIEGFENEYSTCSNCKWTHMLNYTMDALEMNPFHFCPNCGAEMVEVDS